MQPEARDQRQQALLTVVIDSFMPGDSLQLGKSGVFRAGRRGAEFCRGDEDGRSAQILII